MCGMPEKFLVFIISRSWRCMFRGLRLFRYSSSRSRGFVSLRIYPLAPAVVHEVGPCVFIVYGHPSVEIPWLILGERDDRMKRQNERRNAHKVFCRVGGLPDRRITESVRSVLQFDPRRAIQRSELEFPRSVKV